MRNYIIATMSLAALAMAAGTASAAVYRVSGGTASWTIDEGVIVAQTAMLVNFNAAAPRNAMGGVTASDYPNQDSFTRTPGSPSTVTFSDPIRPYGAALPSNGRKNQASTLEFDSTNLLGSWAASNFTNVNISGGEQIGFTNMQKWSNVENTYLLFGDMALRYAPTRAVNGNSGLVLASNVDFANVPYLDLRDASFDISNDALTINATLFTSSGMGLFGSPTQTEIGNFTMTAPLTAVPEPASLGVLAIGVTAMLRRRDRA